MSSPLDFLSPDQESDAFAFWSDFFTTNWELVMPPVDFSAPATGAAPPAGEALSLDDVLVLSPEVAAALEAQANSFDIGPITAPAVFSLPAASMDVEWMLSDRTPQGCMVG